MFVAASLVQKPLNIRFKIYYPSQQFYCISQGKKIKEKNAN